MEVSSPDKLLFPADGITKAQVVEHYRRVGEAMVGILAGRPLTVQRFPRGIEAKGFMQKNAADHFPPSIRRLPVPKRGGGETLYPVVERAEDLVFLANQNTVTFHMWTSSADRPGHPDWLVIDLDPTADDLDGVRTAVLTVREVLTSFGLDGVPVATGSKGFHVWTALDGTDGFDRVSLAARAVAGLAALRAPERLTTEFLKKERKGRVFVDWLRATPTATVVVPFSLRPRPGAPVAVPLTWDEVATAHPDGGRLSDTEAVAERLTLGASLVGGAGDGARLPVDDIEAEARAAGVDLDTPHDRFGRKR
ncbi:MAG: non-homologous end-joining DNA ligase [Actinomycetota bacterium]